MNFAEYWTNRHTEVLDRAVGEELAEIVWNDQAEALREAREIIEKTEKLAKSFTAFLHESGDHASAMHSAELGYVAEQFLTTHPADTGEETEG